MKETEAKEDLRVFDHEGFGTLHKNIGNEHVSAWFVRWDDGPDCAVLDFDYLWILPGQYDTPHQRNRNRN